jgi:hypothetical protein
MPHDKLDVMDPDTRMAQEDAWDVTACIRMPRDRMRGCVRARIPG